MCIYKLVEGMLHVCMMERGWLCPQAVPCKLLGVAAVPTCVAMLENGAGRKTDE